MERYEQVKNSRKNIVLNNFIGGLAWAVGATIGLAFIITILGLVLKNINLIPFVGNFVGDVINFVLQKNPNLLVH